MKKLISKVICCILVLSLVSGMAVPAFAAESRGASNSGITINGIYYTNAEFQELLTHIEPLEDDEPMITPRIAPAIAIPAWAIGKWLIPAIGTIIITPVAIKVGGQIIDSTSEAFTNIINAVKKVVESKTKDDEYKKPKSGSGKDKATDVPSWAKGKRPKKNEDGKAFAKRLCDERYGAGNYDTGPGSEYNKIKKWGDRGFE